MTIIVTDTLKPVAMRALEAIADFNTRAPAGDGNGPIPPLTLDVQASVIAGYFEEAIRLLLADAAMALLFPVPVDHG